MQLDSSRIELYGLRVYTASKIRLMHIGYVVAHADCAYTIGNLTNSALLLAWDD